VEREGRCPDVERKREGPNMEKVVKVYEVTADDLPLIIPDLYDRLLSWAEDRFACDPLGRDCDQVDERIVDTEDGWAVMFLEKEV